MMVNASLTSMARAIRPCPCCNGNRVTDHDSAANWQDYYDATAGRPPRKTLLYALEHDSGRREPRYAIDLGCGDGRDTIELLRRGWSVLAIDAEASALERLVARRDLPPNAKLRTLCGKFQDLDWPPPEWSGADLINASFALPLCPPPAFPALWQRITGSLVPGGRFAGQLYGNRDSWAANPGMTIHDADAVQRLLADYETEFFEEEESDAVTPRGKPKHWHIFHIVARKR